LKKVWTESTRVKGYETDFQGNWKPASFFRAMQGAAGYHAEHLGFGYHSLLEKDMAWILSRVKIRFHQFPTFDKQVTLHTWPKGVQQKILFIRDFNILDSDGACMAAASTAWLLVDIQSMRFLTSEKLPSSMPDNQGLFALDEKLEKISIPKDLPEIFVARARYSDIDLMGHVNNTRYIDWVCDCFESEAYRTRKLSWLQINYTHEVKPGERVSIGMGENISDTSVSLVQGRNLDSGNQAFEAALGWCAWEKPSGYQADRGKTR
jgi:medium-chain acyl-[acyl-carrier-protein] hydrolase